MQKAHILCIIDASLSIIMYVKDTILHIQQCIIIRRASVKDQPDFTRKGENDEKTHKLYIIHA